MNSRDVAKLYDAFYFAHGCGLPYHRSEKHWLRFFGAIADRIIADIQPHTVLDAGCAVGFLVESLRDRGVMAFGVDISEYAIQQVRSDIQPYCRVGLVTDPFPQQYDLIVCIEVLEHLPPDEVELAIANFCRHTDDILFSSTPFDYKEATHFSVQPPEYWAEAFARYGFFRDVDFDTSFLLPWAVRFRRKQESLSRQVREYERKFWLLWKENVDLRNLAMETRQQLIIGEQMAEQAKQAAETTSQIIVEKEAYKRENAELQAELAWLTAQVQRLQQQNWIGQLWHILNQRTGLGVLGGRPVKRLPPLTRPLAQTFVAEYEHLSSLTVLIQHRVQPAIYPLQMTLTPVDAPDEPVSEASISPRHLPAMIGPFTWRFPPIPNSQGQTYRLTFQTPTEVAANQTTLWGYLRPARPGGQLQWGEQRLSGELVMTVAYGSLEMPFYDRWNQPSWLPRSLFNPAALLELVLSLLSGR